MKLFPSLHVLVGLVTGLSVGLATPRSEPQRRSTSPALIVRLHRFALRKDRLKTFDAWIAFERAHHAETVATLERERMVTEAIFRDRERDPATIYWLEVRAAGGAGVESSPLAIDRVYEQYMRATLVPHSRRTMTPEYALVPPFLLRGIAEHEAGR